MSPTEAQNKPEAEDALYDPAAPRPRTQVQGETVPIDRRKGRIFRLAESDRNASENMVPKPAR